MFRRAGSRNMAPTPPRPYNHAVMRVWLSWRGKKPLRCARPRSCQSGYQDIGDTWLASLTLFFAALRPQLRKSLSRGSFEVLVTAGPSERAQAVFA